MGRCATKFLKDSKTFLFPFENWHKKHPLYCHANLVSASPFEREYFAQRKGEKELKVKRHFFLLHFH